ncbi:MAG: 16S rRNA (adenine(1518)-N(6)/adenine(1519)-N(6))-dimethyltransferase RsmA [Candidatus Caldarchaeales archaeon]
MRRLGQHFLLDSTILDRLVDYGEISSRDVVLEVGAGTGELTWRLAERAGKVVAVEIDEKLASKAYLRISEYSNVELITGDILRVDVSGFNKVVSNPPYQISTRLLQWLILKLPEKIVLTLQREFAQKLTSKPGTKKYVYTSFLTDLFYKSEIVEEVPRSVFKPIPRVDSVILSMERRDNSILYGEEELRFIKILFTQKMKKLNTVLRSLSKKVGLDLREVECGPLKERLEKRIYSLNPSELYESVKFILNNSRRLINR